jgi:hypothetical protein
MRPWLADGITTQLLEAVVQAILPNSGLWVEAPGSLPYSDEAGVALVGWKASDIDRQLGSVLGRQVEDDVEVLPPFAGIVLPGLDPESPDPLATKPCRDAVPKTGKEHVQAHRRVDIEVPGVEVEGRGKWLT